MELKDTVALMASADYKERFKAEYYQLVIRFKKLQTMLEKWDKANLILHPLVRKPLMLFRLKQ